MSLISAPGTAGMVHVPDSLWNKLNTLISLSNESMGTIPANIYNDLSNAAILHNVIATGKMQDWERTKLQNSSFSGFLQNPPDYAFIENTLDNLLNALSS
jgi:hypothetical protein